MESTVFRSPALRILDYRCRERSTGLGPEEACTDFEVVLPRNGLFVRHVEGESVVADPNHALFFSPEETHRVSHPAGCGDRCSVLAFSESHMRDALAATAPALAEAPAPRFPLRAVPTTPALDLAHRRLLRRARSAADGAAVEEIAFEVLACLLRAAHAGRDGAGSNVPGPRRAATRRAHAELVDAAKEELARRLGEKLDLAAVAAAVHSSPYHLSRLFRAGTGLGLASYHRRLRLRTGLERILGGERDLTRLALELGFAHHSHFTSAFRLEFGLPPSAARLPLRASPDPGRALDPGA